MKQKMFIGIDTGTHCSVAFVYSKKILFNNFIIEKNNINNFCDNVCHDIFLLKNYDLNIFIEDFKIYNSSVSIISALKGDLDKIIRTSVIFNYILRDYNCNLVNPNWKGTMNDKIVKNRVNYIIARYNYKIISEKKMSAHTFDSIGLAFWGMGLFNEKI